MREPLLPGGQKREFLRRMDLPIRVFVGLMLLLGTNVMLGAAKPAPWIWTVEVGVLLAMVVITMLYSMEILEDLPLIRMWAVAGFAWLCILFGMTLIDYLTRGRFPL